MILVVGGSGRLGRLVVEALSAQHEVRVLARHATTAAPPLPGRVQLVDGDVRDAAAMTAAAEGASCIVVASHGVESRERDGLESVDVLGARAVAAAATRNGCGIVLVSAVGAAPDAAQPLARTKWAAEQIVRECGAPWTIVRAAAFAQTWAMILTLSAGRSGRPSLIGPGAALHRFVDVRDVAAVVARAATDDALRGRILEVCGPDPLTPSQLAAMVQEANSWHGAPRHLPLALARVIGSGLSLFRPDLGRRLTLGIAMNESQPPDSTEGELPTWLAMRPITPETMRWPPASTSVDA
ncbi:SDR family oxidoreductase [Agrococcus beijingensis]|uniref:SDR family oxidoreductase n=1 Tax=Agrococcus beijingensis TaxID=3068634 RepID=UPI002740AC0C|nr:SDR family oxidoreductase [Agrococcus sp. REN33]